MSDVGLGANLELDITAALRRVDQLGRAIDTASEAVIQVDTSSVAPEITAAVDAADSSILVQPDTTGVAGEITSAVDAADTGILVTADAADVTGSIDAAVDDADTGVVVTGDASEITGSITAAVEAADTNVVVTGDSGALRSSVQGALDEGGPFGPISVEGELDAALITDSANLGANLADASDEGRALQKVLALLSIGAAAAALRSLAESASDLAESTSKASVVFGAEFPAIERFATGAADAVGLSTQAAFEAAGTFGNLFQALGTSRAEAARLSPQVVQLAGDLASFNNIGTDEALEKLRSGLVGEIEPLRQLGVSFNALDVDAKALELGLGGVGRELTEGEKVQARYALITEQTTLAQGDFARTSEGLANQQRILRAEFQNAAAAAGTALLPAFQSLIDEVRRALPDLSQVAEDVLPAVAAALANLGPLIGVSTDLLVAMAPAIEIVADLLASIPDEAIAVGAGLLIANRAFGVLGGLVTGIGPALASVPGILRGVASAAPAAASGVGALGAGVQGLATTVAALNPLTVAAGIFAVGLFSAWQQGQEEARNYREELDQLGAALETVDGFQQLTTQGVAAYVKEQSRINAKDQIDDLNRLGISFDQLAAFAQRGVEGQGQFVDLLVQGGELTRVTRNEFGELVTATGEVIDANSELAKSLEDLGIQGLVVGNTDLVASYNEVASVTDDVAKRQIELLQAQGLLTDAQVRTALGMDDSGVATRGYAAALNDLEPLVVAAARSAEAAIAKYGPLADQYLNTADALDRLAEAHPGVASQIQALRTGGAEPTTRSFLNLALGLDKAALSEEQLADAAALLGTDVERLKGFVDTAAESVEEFATTAIGALPTVADAFKNAGDDSILRVREFRQGLDDEAENMRAFTLRLAALTAAGFGELAGVIAQQGPELGGALVTELTNALADGNTVLVEQTQASLDNFNGAWTDTTAYLRDTLGPEFVLTTGLIGSAASTTFGENLTFGERLRIAGEIAALQMDQSGRAVAAIAATEGADAAREYGAALKLDEETIEAAVAAGRAIVANAPTADARAAGTRTGRSFTEGIAAGIREQTGLVGQALQEAIRQAEAAARAAAQAESPSKLFAELGRDIGDGIALGLTQAGAGVVAQAEQIVRDAALSVASVSPEVTLASMPNGGAPAGDGAGAPMEITFDVTVNPPLGMTPDEARTIGGELVDGAVERLAERRLSIVARTQ